MVNTDRYHDAASIVLYDAYGRPVFGGIVVCKEDGMVVADDAAHDRWHEAQAAQRRTSKRRTT